jgi:hypothetical protein
MASAIGDIGMGPIKKVKINSPNIETIGETGRQVVWLPELARGKA